MKISTVNVINLALLVLVFSLGKVKAEETVSNLAINSVKLHPKIQKFLSNKESTKFTTKYHYMELGGTCGFAGCNWRSLVSVVVSSKNANSPSITIIALVEGQIPSRESHPQVTFVELKNSDATSW